MLSERVRVMCPECHGEGGAWNGPMTRKEPCRSCHGTGRDADAERRLGELANRLSAHAATIRHVQRTNGPMWEPSATRAVMSGLCAMDDLAALLLGTEGERDGAGLAHR